MKIYQIDASIENAVYDRRVVIADSISQALDLTHPHRGIADRIICREIGEANQEEESRVVVTEFTEE